MQNVRWLLASCCVAMVMLGSVHVARANVVMVVKPSSTNAVGFAATGNPASVNDSSQSPFTGILLENFFNSATAVANTNLNGNLSPSGTSNTYSNIWDGLGASRTINMYGGHEFATQSFSTTTPAFSGSVTGNLSPYAAFLPSAGATGNIRVGDAPGQGAIIGQWAVVPLPASALLFASALAGGLFGARRFRPSADASAG